MQLSHAIASLEASVETQLRVAGPEAAEAGAQLLAALQPAIRQTLIEVVTMAATEVNSQLDRKRVEVRLVEGDPELVVSPDPSARAAEPPHSHDAETEARITLRLPEYLKEVITEAANVSGDSVNAYVVDALKDSSSTKHKGTSRHRIELDL